MNILPFFEITQKGAERASRAWLPICPGPPAGIAPPRFVTGFLPSRRVRRWAWCPRCLRRSAVTACEKNTFHGVRLGWLHGRRCWCPPWRGSCPPGVQLRRGAGCPPLLRSLLVGSSAGPRPCVGGSWCALFRETLSHCFCGVCGLFSAFLRGDVGV